MSEILETIKNFIGSMGFNYIFGEASFTDGVWMGWQYLVMYAISFVLIYLAIAKKFEPLLLLPIAIGMLLTNLPGANLFHLEMWIDDAGKLTVLESIKMVINKGGFLDLLYMGVKLGIYPCIIFIGIGAMTDFTPLIANPKYFLIGAGAQFGVFVAFSAAFMTGLYTIGQAASIGIIGGADGPTAILVTKTLGPALLGAIAIAAYSYMALIPMIQPPFMKLLTTKKERLIKMDKLRPVSRLEKLVFPILVTFVVGILVPDALSLIGCLMFGNILNVCGVTERLSKTVQNEFMNIITILLGISVGATASAANFLSLQTVIIVVCGLVAFCISTCGGLITAKIMNWLSGGKINPLIGSAGVSAVPMAARVAQTVGQKEDPSNFLLMHAMGPNVAGVIGSAVAAGVFLSWIG
ncbi:MAG: sodium ion-translocating decarboxylase subunit beta [Clostridia bacterium]|nr:sodium ion-translocating decarboxylase subunit beta [Clostridia bacterium]